MVWAATALAGGSSSANAESYATTSVSPTGDAILVAVSDVGNNNDAPGDPTVTGLSLTWVKIAGYAYDTNTFNHLSMWAAITPTTPGSGAITFDYGVGSGDTMTGHSYSVFELTGEAVDTVAAALAQAAVTGSVDTAGTSETISLGSAPTNGNIVVAAVAHLANETTATPDVDWTTLHNVNHGNHSASLLTQYDLGSPPEQTNTSAWTTSAEKGSIIVEFQAAAGGGADQEPALVGGKLTNSLLLEHLVR